LNETALPALVVGGGTLAAAAPAVAVLLSAASKPASAGNGIYQRIPT
jgi:hypothetical protein